MILIATVAISNYHDGNHAVSVQTSTSLNLTKVVPTILTSGTVWDFELGRLHTGREQLRLQATCYPEKILQSLLNNQRQDLAGNAWGPWLGYWPVDVPSIPVFELRHGGSLSDPHPLTL